MLILLNTGFKTNTFDFENGIDFNNQVKTL